MDSELDVIDSLNAIGYKGKCLQQNLLSEAVAGGTRSPEFRELVCWLTDQLHVLRKTDEKVDKEVKDASEFAMELSAMLKELGCPYEQLVGGALSDRFGSVQCCLDLLDYLLTELMCIKMYLKIKPVTQTYVIPKFETDTARALESLTKDLCLGKPPDNISPKALFDKMNFKVEDIKRKTNPNILCEPLLKTANPLTDVQWLKLEAMHDDLDAEYNMRRQVLLTRLEVTIQSFQWSDKMRNREDEVARKFQTKLNELEQFTHGGKDTDIVALLAARSDLAIIEKTSSANVRKNTGTKIQKHVMGSVPDRGGRAYEHAPPPPEMPSWQQQRASGPGRGGGGGGGRGNFQGSRGGNARGRGGGGGGAGGGGGGNWQQYSTPQQGNQNTRPEPFEQRQQFNQGQNQNQSWISGSGRVQGTGWSANTNDRDPGSGQANFSNGAQQQNNVNRGRGGGGSGGANNSYRGRSNYNRGGGNRR